MRFAVAGDGDTLGVPRLEPRVDAIQRRPRPLEATEERLGRYWNREHVS
jgi:hypothetical protein